MKELEEATPKSAAWPGLWLARLQRRLEAARGPVVQVWGWPGSGRGRLLRALARAGGLEIPPAALGDGAQLAAAARAADAAGHPWLLCRRWPGEALRPALEGLTSRPLLIFTGRYLEAPDPESDSLIDPWELLLTPQETATLWAVLTGDSLSVSEARRLHAATDGWQRPLELAAETALRGKGFDFEAAALATLPSVAAFLQGEVLGPLPKAEREALLGNGESWDVLEALRRLHGLIALDPQGRVRRPALVSAQGTIIRRFRESSARSAAPEAWAPRTATAPAERDRPAFEVQLLGPAQAFRVSAGGRRLLSWKLRRALKIFAFLLDQPDRRATRASLVEAVFADEDLEAARRNFHPTMSYLRRCLADGEAAVSPVLLFREGFYELSPEVDWQVDSERFGELVEAGAGHRQAGESSAAAVLWRQAWALYRGPFMDGYDDPWILQRRESLYRTYLDLLRELGNTLADLDRLPEALDAYRAVLVEDPLQEGVQVAVMGLYAAQGRRDLVRRQFDRLSRLLNEELGVEPLQQTTLAYHRYMG